MAGADKVLCIIDICIGCWVAFCGVWALIRCFLDFNIAGFFSSLFTIVFGACTVWWNLLHPGFINDYCGFVNDWLTYGLFIAYCGFSVWSGGNIVSFIFGLIIIVVGIVYIVFKFVSCFERPGPLLGASAQAKSAAAGAAASSAAPSSASGSTSPSSNTA